MGRAAIVLVLVLLVPWLVSVAHAQTANQTNQTNPLEKAVSLTNLVASALQKIAYGFIVIALFIGVIHWVLGRGPEWLSRAVLAAFAIAAGLWVISYFVGK